LIVPGGGTPLKVTTLVAKLVAPCLVDIFSNLIVFAVQEIPNVTG
jgi:hypothetical protein